MGQSACDLAAAIGARVTALRGDQDRSMSSLAARAGIGKATLSEVEAGTRNPTLETLYAIAGALDVPLVALISPGTALPVVRGEAVSATLLEAFDDPGMSTELYRLVLRPGRRQVSPGHGPGVMEYLTVTSGAVLVGPVEAPFEVAAGEHAGWKSAGPHCYQALSSSGAQGVLLIRHPRATTSPFV